MRRIRSCMLGRSVVGLRVDGTSIADKPRDVEIELGIEFVGLSRRAARTRSVRARLDCVAGHIGLELANVALTRRDLHRSLLGVREKSLIRKCSVNPRSSPEITKNRHFRVRVLHGQPRSPVSVGYVRSARIGATFPSQWTAGAVMGRLLNEILLRSCMAAFAIGVVIAAASLLG